MTVAHPDVATRVRARPVPVNWAAIGVIVAILAHLGAAIWFASGISARMHALEEQVPPGALQRLDERTLAMQRVLEHLEARS